MLAELKNNKSIIAILIILIVLVMISLLFNYPIVGKSNTEKSEAGDQENKIEQSRTSTATQEDVDKKACDGNDKNYSGVYTMDVFSSLESSVVGISCVSKDLVNFKIAATQMSSSGDLKSTAYRDYSTSSLVYITKQQKADKEENEDNICQVTIQFLGTSTLIYNTKDLPNTNPEYNAGCAYYHGASSGFFDNTIHIKNLENKFTITKFGFSKEDRDVFEKMNKGLLGLERYIYDSLTTSEDGKSFENARQAIISKDINAKGIRIEAQSLTSMVVLDEPCDFTNEDGHCMYVAFLKDKNGDFYLIG